MNSSQPNHTSLQTGDVGVRCERTWIEACLIWAATAVIAAALMNAAPLQSANDRSRWATVWSLVERRTFQIDEIDSNPRWSTIDKVRYRANDAEPWHFYSSKPPLLSIIVAGLYAIERATIGLDLLNQTPFVSRLLLLIVNVIPFWFVLRSLSRTLSLLGCALPVRVFVLIAAGFGSIINPYLTTLNNHTPAAACAMFAIAAAVRIIMSRKLNGVGMLQPRSGDFAALGFFAALTCCFELPAAQLGVLAFALSAVLSRRATAKLFIPAAAIPLAAFFITNWMVTGGAKPFYATYGTETYEYVHNGVPSYWKNPKDLDANQEHPAVYFLHCVLGHHGLFSLTPFLVISLVGVFLVLKRKGSTLADSVPASVSHPACTRHALRAIILSGALMTAVTLGFYLTRTQNYNYGGNSVGLRWMLWLSPFWWIALVPAINTVNRRITQVICTLLLAASVASASWSIDRPWKASWLYEHLELAGLINYRTPVKPFDRPRGSVVGRLPSMESTSDFVSSDNQTLRLRIDASGVLSIAINPPNEKSAVSLETSAASIPIDRKRWEKSGLLRRESTRSNADSERTWEMFLSGFSPHLCTINRRQFDADQFPVYQATGDRWIPSKSKPNSAWHVERGVARIIEKSSLHGDLMHRCEVWYCDDAPFGVIQWRTTVTSMSSGEILDAVTWMWTDL
jgi:hypothetical protein